MNLKFLKNADDCTFNKANIMPILSAAVWTGIAAVAITEMFTPTLFGSLSEDSLKSLGLTKAVLGFTAFTSKFMVASSI